MWNDVQHYVRSCHYCQLRRVRKAEVSVSTPATLFVKIYVDIMHMPIVQAYSYIVAAKDDLSGNSEGRCLRKKTSEDMACFFWEEILYRYGAIGEVITDNGKEIMGA